MKSLSHTLPFLTQLFGFVDSIYEKQHLYSRFTAEQAWALILDRICEDLYAPKEGVVAAMTVEDPASVCAHMLWACLKTHDVCAHYLEHNFENHPAISAEYVKFLATNSGSEELERMESTVTSVKTMVDKAMEVAKKARYIADGASRVAGVASKAADAVAKKVAKLEDKVFR
jgi:hypothetical protein